MELPSALPLSPSPQPVALLEKPIPSPLLMPAPAIPDIPGTQKGQDKECPLNTAQVVALLDNFLDTPTAPVQPTGPTLPTAPAVLSAGTAPAASTRPKLKVAKATLKLNMAKTSNSPRLRSPTIKPIVLEKHDTAGIASREIGSLSTPDISSADIKMELNSPFDFSGGPPSVFRNMIEEDSTDGPPPTKMVKHDHNGKKPQRFKADRGEEWFHQDCEVEIPFDDEGNARIAQAIKQGRSCTMPCCVMSCLAV